MNPATSISGPHCPFLVALLLVACSVAPSLVAADSDSERLRGTAPDSAVVDHSTPQKTIFDLSRVRRGQSASEAEAILGPASVVAAPDVWIYWDCRLAGTVSESPDLDTLLVVHRKNVVAELRLVRGASMRGLLLGMRRSGP